jgi:hypothetical protein
MSLGLGATTLPFPARPWRLRGWALQSCQFVRSAAVRAEVPPEAKVVSVFPGWTAAGIYLASYEEGSDLVYNELFAARGLVRIRGRVGFWISHIWVDSESSLRGGREVWGVPKQLARFSFAREQGKDRCHFSVAQQDGRAICEGEFRSVSPRLPGRLSLTWPAIGRTARAWTRFGMALRSSLGMAKARFEFGEGSPLRESGLDRPLLALEYGQLEATADDPLLLGPV